MTVTDDFAVADDVDEPLPDGDVCSVPGCTNLLPDGHHPWRKKCDEHYSGGTRTVKKRKERAPRVVVQLGSDKPPARSDRKAAETEKGARAMLQLVAAGVTMSGDQVCAAAIAGGSADLARALGELSKYQPALHKIFAPASASNQLGAWLGVAGASLPIVLVVLSHHHVLPDALAAKIAGVGLAATGDDGAAA